MGKILDFREMLEKIWGQKSAKDAIFLIRDRILITGKGRGAFQTRKILGPKLFAPDHLERGELFAKPRPF